MPLFHMVNLALERGVIFLTCKKLMYSGGLGMMGRDKQLDEVVAQNTDFKLEKEIIQSYPNFSLLKM